jgi:hypothetical protein
MNLKPALKAIQAVAVAAVLAAAFGGAPAVSAPTESTTAVACTLLSSSQLQSTLALSQSTVLSSNVPTGAVSEDVDTQCGWGVWSGAPPTSPAATFALARAGHAAQIGIETWAPNKGHQRSWVATDFTKLTGKLAHESATFPGLFASAGMPSHTIRVPKLGHAGTGFTTAASGPAKGLTVAIGCWWEKKSYKAICVFDEEAASRPVTADLGTLAKIAVAKFLG